MSLRTEAQLRPENAAAMAWGRRRRGLQLLLSGHDHPGRPRTRGQEVNLATPGKDRIAVSAVPWAPEHSIFAPDPWLFGLGLRGGLLVPEDPLAAARGSACVAAAGPVHCPIASLGHPNASGSMAYATAIEAALATLV